MLPCEGCGYKQKNAWDAHITCVFDWATDAETMKAWLDRCSKRTRQWFLFPFNFDPVWGPDECPHRAEEADPKKIRSARNTAPAALGIFRGRGK